MTSPIILAPDDLHAVLDDLLVHDTPTRWDAFYAHRARPCPFFVDAPDESLADWLSSGRIPVDGCALDIGCGNGRNAIHLARAGLQVDAIDFSRAAIDWAAERVAAAGVPVALHCASVFDAPLDPGTFAYVHDSGCFHHIAPHRRERYVRTVHAALRPGGCFGLTCFRPEGGSGLSDRDVYRTWSLGGGLGYTEDDLRRIWSPSRGFEIQVLRRMRPHDASTGLFGEDFLWCLLARKSA